MGDLSDIKYQYGMCVYVFLPHLHTHTGYFFNLGLSDFCFITLLFLICPQVRNLVRLIKCIPKSGTFESRWYITFLSVSLRVSK